MFVKTKIKQKEAGVGTFIKKILSFDLDDLLDFFLTEDQTQGSFYVWTSLELC